MDLKTAAALAEFNARRAADRRSPIPEIRERVLAGDRARRARYVARRREALRREEALCREEEALRREALRPAPDRDILDQWSNLYPGEFHA